MNPKGEWTCDGEPKNDAYSSQATGSHPPYQNTTPDCAVCGLPREAMETSTGKKPKRTIVSGTTFTSKPGLLPILLAIVGVILLLGVGFGLYRVIATRENNGEEVSGDATTAEFVSSKGVNGNLISQGEKILLSVTPEKTSAASAFASKDWLEAIARYQQATDNNRNDPESKIYLHNTQAIQAGNPLTIAAVVPIASSSDTAQEILRGVAQAQDEFNSSNPPAGRLLQVVIVNDLDSTKSAGLAQDLVQSPQILGVLGHGIDSGSRQAIAIYEQNNLAVLSPVSTSITPSGDGNSTVKTIPQTEKAGELLGNYLQTVGITLAKYANSQQSSPAAVVFFNSDSPYSELLKREFINALSQQNGKVVKEVDVTTADVASEINAASQAGANIAMLALSKNKVNQAVEIAQANASLSQALTLIGGDELYNPTILVAGGDAIADLVLAVPWRSQPNDPFATDAANIWKGRVSWRTATAYDATQALIEAISQNATRDAVSQQLASGIPIEGTNTQTNVLEEVPLVQATLGTEGPPGSQYQFDPVP
ncbi:MAG: ABC transporter substrate-binding protein [Oscillatoria sp. PMC 1068.18]|nr:ABC transporter substrate-binding protein [Oscillatoria sp. PMC 1076.18]MEC4987141.1 ABC transporter substrate-binding protein [Oscillatoria sp. PMC 1068.18]